MDITKAKKPKIGEIRGGDEIGYQSHRTRFIWAACDICGKERWVKLAKGGPQARLCWPCGNRRARARTRGERNATWKGGSGITTEGYRWVLLQPDDFFFPMASQAGKHSGHILEHRLVMAKHLKRCLLPWEHVHHKNGDRLDNRIENLELVRPKEHRARSHLEAEVRRLQKRVTLLEAENVLLNARISELEKLNESKEDYRVK